MGLEPLFCSTSASSSPPLNQQASIVSDAKDVEGRREKCFMGHAPKNRGCRDFVSLVKRVERRRRKMKQAVASSQLNRYDILTFFFSLSKFALSGFALLIFRPHIHPYYMSRVFFNGKKRYSELIQSFDFME